MEIVSRDQHISFAVLHLKLHKHDVGLKSVAIGLMPCLGGKPPSAWWVKAAHWLLLKSRHQVTVSIPLITVAQSGHRADSGTRKQVPTVSWSVLSSTRWWYGGWVEQTQEEHVFLFSILFVLYTQKDQTYLLSTHTTDKKTKMFTLNQKHSQKDQKSLWTNKNLQRPKPLWTENTETKNTYI